MDLKSMETGQDSQVDSSEVKTPSQDKMKTKCIQTVSKIPHHPVQTDLIPENHKSAIIEMDYTIVESRRTSIMEECQ